MTWILVAATAILIGYVIVIYNDLVKKKNMVEEGWSGIETQLKRRANLIPNLVETVKGYADHERKTLEEVTELRTRSLNAQTVEGRAEAESALTQALGHLFAVAEEYPELRASENFASLQQDLGAIEDQIQLARRYYNGTVRNLNILIESFPSNLIAGTFNFDEAEFFEIQDHSARAVPQVSFAPESE